MFAHTEYAEIKLETVKSYVAKMQQMIDKSKQAQLSGTYTSFSLTLSFEITHHIKAPTEAPIHFTPAPLITLSCMYIVCPTQATKYQLIGDRNYTLSASLLRESVTPFTPVKWWFCKAR